MVAVDAACSLGIAHCAEHGVRIHSITGLIIQFLESRKKQKDFFRDGFSFPRGVREVSFQFAFDLNFNGLK